MYSALIDEQPFSHWSELVMPMLSQLGGVGVGGVGGVGEGGGGEGGVGVGPTAEVGAAVKEVGSDGRACLIKRGKRGEIEGNR